MVVVLLQRQRLLTRVDASGARIVPGLTGYSPQGRGDRRPERIRQTGNVDRGRRASFPGTVGRGAVAVAQPEPGGCGCRRRHVVVVVADVAAVVVVGDAGCTTCRIVR